MKTFGFPWHTVLMAAMLSSASANAQLVTVPISCKVVVAGTGGVTGFGGKVGDGGIVTMPEPYAGNTFTLSGATPIKWFLLGDLSIAVASPPTPPAPPVSSAGAVTTVKIMSYNKHLRLAETGTPSTNARSKGQVTIVYSQGVCNNKMIFDIYKVWGNPAATTYPDVKYAPPVAGPDCWPSSPQLVTFSVDQVSSDNALDAIGFDQYYWEILNRASTPADLVTVSGVTYTSADRSSITIDMNALNFAGWFNPTGPNPYTINVCYGRANPWDGGTTLSQATTGVTCVTKTIGIPPTQPTLTVTPNCPPWNTNTFTASVSSGGYACSWSTNGTNPLWTLTPSGTDNQTVTVTTAGPNPGTLYLTMLGNCGQYIFSYPIDRDLNGITPTINNPCVSPGGTFIVSLPADAQNNCTDWTITPTPSPAWGFTQNATGSVRTYTIPAGTCAAQYSITAAGCNCGTSSNVVLVNVRPATPAISGPTCVPYNAVTPAQVYTSTTPCGAADYTWTNNLGMSGSSTTNSISYLPLGTAGGHVQVVANGTAGCNSTMATLNVNRTPPTPAVTWPCINVGLPGSTVFSVTSPVAGMSYTWSFPTGLGSFTGGAATSKTVNTLGNPGTYNCSVTANNASGPSCGPVTDNFQVVVAYSTAVAAVNQATSSTVVATPGQSSYQLWNCTTGSTQGSPQTGNTFNLTNPGAGSYSVNITTLAGCVERPACVSTTHSFMAPDGTGPDQQGPQTIVDPEQGFIIHPNPSTGAFTVSLLREVVKGLLTIYDGEGRQVGEPVRLALGENPVQEEQLAPGTYHLRLELDGKVETRSIVITAR